MTEYVILVDTNDEQTGTMEKQEAHRIGMLHRAVSVFVVNSAGEWLLQQRANDKYHSPSLWSNTCCTHPYPGESNREAALRRLEQEMGILCDVQEVFQFTYKEVLPNDLIEYELDHVFVGLSDENPRINPAEVNSFRYVGYEALKDEMKRHPEHFTVWFHHMVHRVHEQFIHNALKMK